MAIDTTFSEEGDAFRSSMRRFFLEHSPLEAQRISSGTAVGLPHYWGEFAQLELLNLGLPANDGSTETDLVDVFPLYLEMGRALAMSPHLATAMTALPIIAELDVLGDHAELMANVTRGEQIVVPAFAEAERTGPLGTYEMKAERFNDGWKVFGEKLFVQYAHVASYILVPAKTDEDELTAFLVPAENVEIVYMENASSVPIFQVSFKGAEVPDSLRVGALGNATSAMQRARDRAAVLRSVEVVGAGEFVLELCLEYANLRKQFGTAIGSFQAVQYLCTDIALANRITFLHALQCAVKIDHDEPYARELAALRKFAKRAASVIVGRAQEVHAGVAFMDEYDLHLFTRRSLFWQAELGDDDEIIDALVTAAESIDMTAA